MKAKKLILPVIIIFVTILAVAASSVLLSVAKKPEITQKDFAFSITYELNGEQITIDDVYTARYLYNDGYAYSDSCVYAGEIKGVGEKDRVEYTLLENANGRIILDTNFYAGYMMGDPEYNYFENDVFQPQIYYYDLEENEYTDEETLQAQGVKLISFEYPTPVKNNFVYSHISDLSSEIAIPTTLVGVLGLVAIVIFVKKEKDIEKNVINLVSMIFNFVVGFMVVPFFAIVAALSDISGDNDRFTFDLIYFLPVFSLLCVAASIALRRKKFAITSLVVQFMGPVMFVLIMVLDSLLAI